MNTKTQRLTSLAIMSAIAYLLMFLTHNIRFMPEASYLSLDMKDVIIVMGGFLYGPWASLMMSLVVSIIERFTVSSTGEIGLIMNVLASCSFACPAAYLYSRIKTQKSAVIGLAMGCLLATGMMLLWNYIITPIYQGVPRDVIAGMLLPIFLPFNLIKTGVNASIILILYKPLVDALRRSHLLPASQSAKKGKINLGVTIAAGIFLLTLVLIMLAYKGVI